MNAASIPFNQLFDPDFLASLSHLTLPVRRVAAGGRFGERLSRQLGPGLEFRDYRSYSPGDDLRAVDWNIYRRLGRVFLRLYEEQQDLPLYLMPDVSASMFHEPTPRAVTALRCALALAAISLKHHDRASLFPFAEDVDVRVRSISGSGNTMALAGHLARLSPPDGAHTDLEAAVRRLASMNLRRGLLVILSDFFDPGGIGGLREALRGVRHGLLFVQLLRASDATPQVEGNVRLRDCETGDVAEITVNPHVLEQYREAYDRFNLELSTMVAYYRGGLLRLDVERDLIVQLNAFFDSGTFTA